MDYLLLILATAALTGWLILHRTSRAVGRPAKNLLQDLFRADLDRLPLTQGSMNRAYQKVARNSGVKGPYGLRQPRKHLVILTPNEDYGYIQSFGMAGFESQLLSYLHSQAAEQGWSVSEDTATSTIHFAVDSRRKRLRPIIADAGIWEKKTDFLPQSKATRNPAGADKEPSSPTKSPSQAEEQPTEFRPVETEFFAGSAPASLSYKGIVSPLPEDGGEVLIGRGEGSHVVIEQKHFSLTQLVLWREEGDWKARTAGGKNATYINGHVLSGQQTLRKGDAISVGSSEPIIFQTSTS